MKTFRDWIAGKKTYLLAALLMAVVGVLVYLGRLTPDTAYTVALFSLAGFAVTFRSALAANQAKVLAVLADVAAAGAAARTHNRDAQVAAAVATAKDGAQLAAAMDALPPVAAPAGGDTHFHINTLDPQAMVTWLNNGGAKVIASAISSATKGAVI